MAYSNRSHPKYARSKKAMLFFGLLSITMMFAGLTSAYMASRNRADWPENAIFPDTFYWSTLFIVISSLTFFVAQRAIKKEQRTIVTISLISTLILGFLFVLFQFLGFSQIIESGFYFTGKSSTISSSFLYVLVFSHLLHIFAALFVLLVVIYNHYKKRYTPTQSLGLQLGAMFWHFLGALWIYLILFLSFMK